MAIPDEDVAAVRAAIDIVALIGEHTALKKVGRRFVGLCPFHGEKTASFSVNAEDGLYYCFGCQVSGDAISFVRAIEGCDFVEAIERLAARCGVTIHHQDDPQAAEERAKRQRLYDAVAAAVDFYHQRLLTSNDSGAARHYLRSRGYDGEVVRKFSLGYAPSGYDELAKALKFPRDVLQLAGLVYVGQRGSPVDVFRDRVIFPIFDPAGKPIALGGRYLPEDLRRNDRDPGPKYRNSAESPIYQKRRTLYGLNWAKASMSHGEEAVVCEGYTDVIGFNRAGVPHAVATCGTALTEDHFRVLGRFAKRMVLVFDGDAAGQNATARIYEWERRHELELSVAALPPGADPGSLAEQDPEKLREAVQNARPFLAFRVERAIDGVDISTPEGRSRAAERAIAVVAEHPNDLVRDTYLRQIADRTNFAPDQLRARLDAEHAAVLRGEREPVITEPRRQAPRTSDHAPTSYNDPGPAEDDAPYPPPRPKRQVGHHPGRDALALAIHQPHDVAGKFDALLFTDPVEQRAFLSLCSAVDLHKAIADADTQVAALLSELAVVDLPDDLDVDGTLVALVRNAGDATVQYLVRQARLAAEQGDNVALARYSGETSYLKQELEELRDPLVQVAGVSPTLAAANRLLAWLQQQDGEGKS